VTARQRVEIELPPAPGSVARARDGLDALRGSVADGTLEDVRLLISEIVTNSVRHAGLGPTDRVAVRVIAEPGRVRAEVVDTGKGFEAPPHGPTTGASSGWGLFLVERVANRWGVERRDGRTRVWFEIDR
jgi:anti-sigma regulatory factor (Ser/Thr protein kinase)